MDSLISNVKKKASISGLKETPITETPTRWLLHLISLCHLNSSDLSGHLRVSALPGTRKLAIDALDPVRCLCSVQDSVTSHESTTELGSGQFGGWDRVWVCPLVLQSNTLTCRGGVYTVSAQLLYCTWQQTCLDRTAK